MTTTPPSGEHIASLEYLKEYGQLVIDVTNLLEAFDARKVKNESETTFSFYALDEPYHIPSSIEERIGTVNSADVTHSSDGVKSITIELFGEQGSYAIKRSQGADQATYPDAHFKFKPLDSVEQSLLTREERMSLPRVQGEGEELDHLLDKIPTISNAKFISILMELTHQGITKEFTPEKEAQLQKSDVFNPDIYDHLYESSRITAMSQFGNLHYELLGTTGATLSYFYEAGQPASFFISAPDDTTGEVVKLRGNITKDVSIEAPRQASSPGEVLDWPIDSVLNDGPTLRELKLVHEVLDEELKSLPEIPNPLDTSIEMVTDMVTDEEIIAVESSFDDQKKKEADGTDDKSILLDLEYLNFMTPPDASDEENS